MKIIDYLLPKQCIFCGKFSQDVCKECADRFFIRKASQYCHVCKKPSKSVHQECQNKTSLDGAFICIEYNKSVLKIIETIKYSFYHKYVDAIAVFYAEMLRKQFGDCEDLILVPVPIHKKREWARGFNQAKLIAKELAKLTGFETVDLLIRIRNTRTQVGLSRKERLTNLDEAFALNESKVANWGNYIHKPIILIDDVMTTGTTLEKCALPLRGNGAGKIFAITLTRG